MLVRFSFLLPLLVLILTVFGCTMPKVSRTPSAKLMAAPVRLASADLAVTLMGIAEQGSDGTLVEDPGWREYIMEIENLSTNVLTVQNVKLLNQTGRYVDSALAYDQITAPPDVNAGLAGDVAGKAAGMAASQFVPCGGTIFSVLSDASTASSAGAKAKAKQDFMLRVLKNVELAPAGKVEGSAFLPNIPNPRALVVVYTQNDMTSRMEIPLRSQAP